MRLIFAAGAVALLSMATAAQAGTHIGWYVAADAGIHKLSSQHLSVSDVTLYSRDFDANSGADLSSDPVLGGTTGPYSLQTKAGPAIFARAGYQFSPNWRAELELGDRESKIKHSLLDGNDSESGAAGRGHLNLDSTMLNVLYDFAPDAKLHPFVGLGAGTVRVKTTYRGEFVPTQTTGDPYDITTTYKISKKKFNTAWQFIAGLTWAASDRLNVDLTYRWFDAGRVHYNITADSTYNVDVTTDEECPYDESCCDPESECCGNECESVAGFAPRAAVAAQSVNTVPVAETDIIGASSRRLRDQSLTIGLRWSFAAPPPPAPPVEAAAPPPPPPAPTVPPPPAVDNSYGPQPNGPNAQSYTVYFAFDRSNLSDTALQVINSAATFAKSRPSPAVTVTGHTDTSGSNAYNVALSMRRAQAVAKGLVADGVDGGAIKTGWTGEKDLAVPTPNGTPNPENRRTTIDVNF